MKCSINFQILRNKYSVTLVYFHFSVALLQLALWDEVFLLDIPALLLELTDDDWRLLATWFFNNDAVLKLGTI